MNKMVATAFISFLFYELRLRSIIVFDLRMLNRHAIVTCGALIKAAFFKKGILTMSELQTVTLL